MENQEIDDPGQGGSNFFVASSHSGQGVIDDLLRRQQISPHAVDHVLIVRTILLLSMILGRHVLDCLVLNSLLSLTGHVASILNRLDGEGFKQSEGK
jgi:hypothetical protein